MKMNKKILGGTLAIIASLAIAIPNYLANNTVYTTLTLDINPSVALGLNKANEVVKVTPINEDAKTLNLNEALGLTAQEATNLILEDANSKGYVKSDAILLITAVDEQATTAEAFIKDFENTFELTDALHLPIGFLITDQQTLKRAIEKEIATSLLTLDPSLNSPQKISAYMAVEDNRENLEDHVQWLDEDDFEDLLDLIYADVPIDESKDNDDDDSGEDNDDDNEIKSKVKDNSEKIASNDDDEDETRTEEDEDDNDNDNSQSATVPFHKAAVKSSDESTSDDEEDAHDDKDEDDKDKDDQEEDDHEDDIDQNTDDDND